MGKIDDKLITKVFFTLILLVAFVALIVVSFTNFNLIIFYALGYLFYGFAFLTLLLFLIFQYLKNRETNKIFFAILFGTLFILWAVSLKDKEMFKSKRVFRANTVGRSFGGTFLTLRKNGKYELSFSSMFGTMTRTGKYQIDENQIILLNKPSDADFLPDTLLVFCHKIPIYKNSDGSHDFRDFYFRINQNDTIQMDSDCSEVFDYGWEPN